MKYFEEGDTQIFALGGLGEVGKNMYCVMHGNEIIITDAGVTFPAGELMGIDYVIPDFTFLKKNEKKIKGYLLHMGMKITLEEYHFYYKWLMFQLCMLQIKQSG